MPTTATFRSITWDYVVPETLAPIANRPSAHATVAAGVDAAIATVQELGPSVLDGFPDAYPDLVDAMDSLRAVLSWVEAQSEQPLPLADGGDSHAERAAVCQDAAEANRS